MPKKSKNKAPRRKLERGTRSDSVVHDSKKLNIRTSKKRKRFRKS